MELVNKSCASALKHDSECYETIKYFINNEVIKEMIRTHK